VNETFAGEFGSSWPGMLAPHFAVDLVSAALLLGGAAWMQGVRGLI
jgi:hypothetical protein